METKALPFFAEELGQLDNRIGLVPNTAWSDANANEDVWQHLWLELVLGPLELDRRLDKYQRAPRVGLELRRLIEPPLPGGQPIGSDYERVVHRDPKHRCAYPPLFIGSRSADSSNRALNDGAVGALDDAIGLVPVGDALEMSQRPLRSNDS